MTSNCARCDFTGDLAIHADDAGHPVCGVCERRSLTIHERLTCATCVGRVRADLADIENYCARLPGVLVENRMPALAPNDRPNSDHELALPGGDAMVMSAPGGAGWTAGSRTGNRDHAADELEQDAKSPQGMLATHEDDWRNLLKHPAAGPPNVATSIAYLNEQLERMAQTYSEFDTFARDLRDLRARLQFVVGLSDQPVRGADCFDCGARLVRRYQEPKRNTAGRIIPGTGGLEDDWTCPRCERVYTQAEYFLAVRAALEAEAAS